MLAFVMERDTGLRQINIGLAAEMARIGLQGKLLDTQFVRKFDDLADAKHRLILQVCLSDLETHIAIGDIELPDIGYPVVAFQDFSYLQGGASELVTSAYGSLPNAVIDADRALFLVSNHYVFSLDGEAYKLENITKACDAISLKDELETQGLIEDKVRRLNIVLKEGSSIVDLLPADYERIATMLAKIKNGELRDIRERSSSQ